MWAINMSKDYAMLIINRTNEIVRIVPAFASFGSFRLVLERSLMGHSPFARAHRERFERLERSERIERVE
jgi:hypothetical protein